MIDLGICPNQFFLVPFIINKLHSQSTQFYILRNSIYMGCINSQPQVILLNDFSTIKTLNNITSIQRNGYAIDTKESDRQKQRKKINKVEFMNQAQTLEPTQNVILSTEEFTVEDKQMLDVVLSKNYIFHKLPFQERKQLIEKFILYDSSFDQKIRPQAVQKELNQYLFKKNDIGTMFFVIKEGSIEIELDKTYEKLDCKKLAYSRGDSFGQLALLYKTSRTASAKCLTKCTFLCISNHVFHQVLQNIVQRTIQSNKITIERIKLFQYLGPKEQTKLANNVVILRHQKGDVVFRKGEDSLAFFVIASGRVTIQVQNKPLLQLRAGDHFGESCFQDNAKRSGTVECAQRTQLLSISKSAIKKVFGDQVQQFYYFSILKWALKRNPILSLIPSKTVQKLLKESDIVCFANGHKLLKQGEKVRKLYIPIEGAINDYEIGDIVNCEYLSDIQKDKKTPILTSIQLTKITQGYVCVMDINKVLSILQKYSIMIANINSKQFEDMKKTISSKKQFQAAHAKSIKQIRQQSSSIQVQNLTLVQKLSEGQFGSVYKVRHVLDQSLYVLKTFKKHEVDSYKMRRFVKQEIQIMQMIKEHQFIVQYHKHYQLEEHLLILMELIDGKDFFDLILEIVWLNAEQIKFYFATFVLALEFLHENDIIYRDVKPENAVLQSTGYLKLIDLGTARKLSQINGYRSFTIIGTPHYMAPQVISGKGYSFQADIWSMGILLYQLACGCFPFGEKLQSPVQIYNEIIKQNMGIDYPKEVTDNSIKSLIQRLLVKDPIVREIQNFNQIKNSEFYQGFQWDKFETKSMKSLFKPDFKDEFNQNLKNNKKYSEQSLLSFLDKLKNKDKKENPKVSFPNWQQF